MPDQIYVFIDANIPFSASYQINHPFLQFWNTLGVISMTSFYAANEAKRNCKSVEQMGRLEQLLERTFMVSDMPGDSLPAHIRLPRKDQPIIMASAIRSGAHYLVTGDTAHFSAFMDRPITTHLGILTVLRPSILLAMLAKRT